MALDPTGPDVSDDTGEWLARGVAVELCRPLGALMILDIAWTVAGDLRVDDIKEDQPKLVINFLDSRQKPRLEKLEFLLEIVQAALNTSELTRDQS